MRIIWSLKECRNLILPRPRSGQDVSEQRAEELKLLEKMKEETKRVSWFWNHPPGMWKYDKWEGRWFYEEQSKD